MEHRYALIVGINDYKHTEHFVPLTQAQEDARALYQFLLDSQSSGWSADDSIYLEGEAATRDELESHIHDLLLVRAQPGDLVIFYFAGYAFFDMTTQDGYLALHQTRTDRPATGLHVPTLVDRYLASSKASQILTVLDIAPGSSGWQKAGMGARNLFAETLLDLPANKGRNFLTTLRPVQGKRKGSFMMHLLKALQGEAINPLTGRITLGTLYDALGEQMRRNNPLFPQKFGYEYGPMVLFEQEEWKTATAVPMIYEPISAVSYKEWHVLTGHRGHVDRVAFSPDGSWLASGGNDMTVRLWAVEGGEPIRTLTGHEGTVMSVAISPDGRLLASSSEDKKIRLWESKTGKLIQVLQGHKGAVWSLAFSPDGRWLASSSSDEDVYLWQCSNWEPFYTLRGHDNIVVDINFSADGCYLASCSLDHTLCLWNLDKSVRQARLAHNDIVYGVAWSPEENLLASASRDGSIKLWNVLTNRQQRILQGHRGAVWALDFSADGQLLISGAEDRTIKVWDAHHGNELLTLPQSSEAYNLACGPEGLLAYSTENGSIVIGEISFVEESET